MRRVSLFLASVVFASSLLGCPLLKKKGADAGADGEEDPTLADAATVSVSGTGAKNEGNIPRYANEEALDEVAVIGKDGTKARNFPGNGPEVATLKKGTVVKKMAKYFATGVLVMFDDPEATDGSKLMGWVTPASLEVSAPDAPKPVWTPPKVVDAGGIKPSTVDAGGGGGAHTTTDAGAAAKDAGGTAVHDAGGGGTAVVDAGGGGGGGGAIPQPKPGTVAVQPINGKCPDNWAVHQNMCRRVCNADADCPRGTKCKPGTAKKVCTAD